MTFFIWLGSFIAIGLGFATELLRKGGVYNPEMPSIDDLELKLPVEPQMIDSTSVPFNHAVEPITPPTNDATALMWDTVANTRHSCRVIMDTYGFLPKVKDLLCAVIMSESGMNIRAINHNKNGSYDYGLVQVNSTYWVGKGKYFESEQEVYDHPEKSVKFLCDSYNEGKLNRWYGYTNKSYLRYM